MAREYVTFREGSWKIGSSRVTLDSVVALFREGVSAEGMVESFPSLTLEQVHGALAFYLANRHELEDYLRQGKRLASDEEREWQATNAELVTKLRRARNEAQIPRG